MKTKKVIIEKYNYTWPIEFQKLKIYLENKLEDNIISIEHVGSTSVEGLSAKAILDIDIVIKDYSKFAHVKSILESCEYYYEGNLGIKQREAFSYNLNNKKDFMVHHLYVCPKNSDELKRHLAFREYLKTHKNDKKRYGEIKLKASKLYPENIDKYIDYKKPFIDEIYNKIGI